MSGIPNGLRQKIIRRAADRCEYCGLSQAGQEAAFHIDHVIPRVAGGQTVLENLALACVSCSLRKSARLVAIDPATGIDVPLFNPREQAWSEHFRWEGSSIIPLTSTGRATVIALAVNRPLAIAIRSE